jgi:hypothetical protein
MVVSHFTLTVTLNNFMLVSVVKLDKSFRRSVKFIHVNLFYLLYYKVSYDSTFLIYFFFHILTLTINAR